MPLPKLGLHQPTLIKLPISPISYPQPSPSMCDGDTVKRTSSGGKRRGKGRRGEYHVAESLCTWYGVAESFYRSAASGAHRFKAQSGDTVTPPLFPFITEIKNQEKWQPSQFVSTYNSVGTNNCFWDYWVQTANAAIKYNRVKNPNQLIKQPMLIFKKNYSDYMVMLSFELFRSSQDFPYQLTAPEDYCVIYNERYGKFVVMLFDAFLECNPPTTFNM